MSKMDDLRAMREARYEKAQAAGRPTTRARTAPVAPAVSSSSTPAPKKAAAAKKAAPKKAADAAGAVTEELCGHRAISGRTCTREQGHAAKSHRYS